MLCVTAEQVIKRAAESKRRKKTAIDDAIRLSNEPLGDKHTPAPWTVEREPSHYGTLSIVSDGPGALRVEIDGWARPPEQEANARLIASAPDLLAALQLWVVFDKTGTPNGEYDNAMKATYAAIAKATGVTRAPLKQEASPHLIAAAPDLLAALEKCVDSLQAEIHKRNYNCLANGYAISKHTLSADMETINAARAAIAKATEL